MGNTLIVYVFCTLDGFAQKSIKIALLRSFGIDERDYESTNTGFKFLFDSETGGHVQIDFEKVNSNLRIKVSGEHAWEVVEVYRLVEGCFDREESFV